MVKRVLVTATVCVGLWLCGAALVLAAEPVSVRLQFGEYLFQLDGTDGASVCQFHSAKPDGSAAAANVAYSPLDGFPKDEPGTDFARFCDTAFSIKGMGLGQHWATPCPLQTPPGSVGDHYRPESWRQLDFSMYEPNLLPTNRFYNTHGKDMGPIYGHTITMLNASLRRARAEHTRVCYWTDVHTDFPPWMWKDGLRKNPVRDECFEEAALHSVYFIKYLVARHGIPIYAASFVNEPDLPGRHHFTPDQLIRAAKILRERLDEAGLTGVKVMPCSAVSMNRVYLDWVKTHVDVLNALVRLLEGPQREYLPYADLIGGHGSQSEPPIERRLPNTPLWRASGDFNEHWTNTVGFDMGPPEMLDEVIRHNTWLYAQEVAQGGIWQVASRMGIGNDFFRMPRHFDPRKFGRPEAIDGAAAVYPYLRPGMLRAAGSQGRPAREPYSVDGFGGRGHREVAIISNSGQPRRFYLELHGIKADEVEVHQATVANGLQHLGRMKLSERQISIEVPADSVTTLVAVEPATRPRLYLVVQNSESLTGTDRQVLRDLREFEVVPVSESLSAEEQTRFRAKRHPVDAFGAAAFIISESVTRPQTVQAYRAVMAPVIALGEKHQKLLGLKPSNRILPGDFLSSRDELDPPAELLDAGLPRACGARVALSTRGTKALLEAVAWTIAR